LFWFGIFSIFYGIRELARLDIVHLQFEFSETIWHFVVSFLNYLIIIPAFLFTENFYGKGWNNSVRWLSWGFSVYAIWGILKDIYTSTPYSTLDPGRIMLIVLPLVILSGIYFKYQSNKIQRVYILVIGATLFIISVLNEHLVSMEIVPWHIRFETYGFMILIFCLGYMAVRQFIDNERQLVSIEEEMRSARLIQETIIPVKSPEIDGISTSMRYLPMASVGGDFFDFITAGNEELGILISDVTGHGVSAAMVSSMLKVAFSDQQENISNPAEVIRHLNKMICRQVNDVYCTACYLYINLREGTASYASAGHPPVLKINKGDESLEEFNENNLMLGVAEETKYENYLIDIKPDDRILLYTDGIIEAENNAEELFGEERLKSFLRSNSVKNIDTLADYLLNTVVEWSVDRKKESQSDDIALVIIDIEK